MYNFRLSCISIFKKYILETIKQQGIIVSTVVVVLLNSFSFFFL